MQGRRVPSDTTASVHRSTHPASFRAVVVRSGCTASERLFSGSAGFPHRCPGSLLPRAISLQSGPMQGAVRAKRKGSLFSARRALPRCARVRDRRTARPCPSGTGGARGRLEGGGYQPRPARASRLAIWSSRRLHCPHRVAIKNHLVGRPEHSGAGRLFRGVARWAAGCKAGRGPRVRRE